MFGNTSGVRLDPELLQVSRQVDIGFMKRPNAYRKRPRHWATEKGIPVILTKLVDANKGDAKGQEYRSRSFGNNSNAGTRPCRERLRRWDRSSA